MTARAIFVAVVLIFCWLLYRLHHSSKHELEHQRAKAAKREKDRSLYNAAWHHRASAYWRSLGGVYCEICHRHPHRWVPRRFARRDFEVHHLEGIGNVYEVGKEPDKALMGVCGPTSNRWSCHARIHRREDHLIRRGLASSNHDRLAAQTRRCYYGGAWRRSIRRKPAQCRRKKVNR